MLTSDWASNHGPDFADQVFAIGDVHGQADALESLLDHIDSIPRAGRREIIFLGDLCDRGPDSLRCFDLAWNAAARADERHILPGNHELTMLRVLSGDRSAMLSWERMGGIKTLLCVKASDECDRDERVAKLRDALPDGLEDMLRYGATHLVREDVLYVHAGIHPMVPADEFLGQDRFIWRGRFPDAHWAYIRQPFLDWECGWEAQGFHLVVHGHSPATTKPLRSAEEAAQLLDVADKHRAICIDAGAAMRMPQVAAVEFLGTQHRLHVAAAPADWADDPFADWRKPLGDTVDLR